MAFPTQATLPTEVWSQILRNVPKSQQPQLLNVNSLFHDIIIGSLFSSIKIYFIGGEQGSKMLNTKHTDWIEETARKLMCKSWELLNHMVQEPRFANVVKSITVIAFADGLSVFERSNTLIALPALRTFRWFGTGPTFDDTVAECLPVHLQTLDIQSQFPLLSLQHLQKLTTLHLPMPLFYPDDEEAHDDVVFDNEISLYSNILDVSETLDSLSSTDIRNLRILATQIVNVPIRVFNVLTALDICCTTEPQETIVGLDLIFHHATALESLSFIGSFSQELFTFFPRSGSSSLPSLNSFRLSLDIDAVFVFFEIYAWALCDFLKGRTALRRLYLRLPAMQNGSDFRTQLIETVRDLQGLEVLGLHTGHGSLSGHDVDILARSLSVNLRALHLAFVWGAGSLLGLVDVIAQLPHLSFLHLYGVEARLPLLLEDLADEGKKLQTIGLNRALWTINRVGSEIITEKWPRWKIKFCVEEDFVCDDDAWLFKYN
ncbi:hypothetical protein B0H34DRAFT_652695 [Crassisporium funariophilum]|nr:hypothetical protein B0H34DRAFT_652695 [Crassisporium funariophilum]